MNLLYPFKGSPKERLARLIGQTNGFTLDPSKVRFGIPHNMGNWEKNTFVLVFPEDDTTTFTGSTAVEYDRLPIDVIKKGAQEHVFSFKQKPLDLEDVLTKVSAFYKADLVVDDFVPEAVVVGKCVVLEVSEDSLTWLPGSVLIVEFELEETPLSELAQVVLLDGFHPV